MNDNNLLDNASLDGIERHLNNPSQGCDLFARLKAARPFAVPLDKETVEHLGKYLHPESLQSLIEKFKPIPATSFNPPKENARD